MPRFSPQKLREIGYALFEAADCREEDAKAVVDHLVESNLFGHDSHGAIRFYEYARAIREGRFNPKSRPEIIKDHPAVAVVDAGGAMGQVGATFATELAIQKAKEYGVGTVALRNTSHIGRVGAYPLMAAKRGFIGQIFVNAGHLGYQIAPFGGLDGKLSTNPLAFSAPRRCAEPLMVDMTTSVVAEGKIRVAMNRGDKVPDGWLIDYDGNPTNEPADFKGDPPGAILPLGGVVAHKGTGLSLMVEVLGGLMSGLGCANGSKTMHSNGVFLNVYNIEYFTDLEEYYDEFESLIGHVKSSRIAPGFKEILIAGEPEYRNAVRVEEEGIEVDVRTWEQICEEAELVGIDVAVWDPDT
ncbi:MAG: Ldh family oxidoreductase [Candidatus Latescibacterota bacterium]|nr:Ldh family oxidoreductase [Candidatus Latescibacterota bacterium]